MVTFLLVLAAAPAVVAGPPASINPHAAELFDRDPVLNAWAVQTFDRNRDGWLTSYEAQPAVATFKEMADADRNGRVTVREFEDARALVQARFGVGTGGSSLPGR